MRHRLLKGGTLLHLDPPAVASSDVRIRDGRIVEVGAGLRPADDEEVMDASGRWIMPGLVCGHHHLYSALACGMPLPKAPPETFTRMLEEVWWRLDKAHDEDSVEVSGLVGGLLALKCGVTCVIDHHASPAFIDGSLEVMDAALAEVGLRRILCYEVSDRGGRAEARAGLRAHERLLKAGPDGRRTVLVGGHASFTLSDDTLREMGLLAREHGVGVHIHVAEAKDDEETTGEPLIARLERTGALLEDSLLAHCVFLSDEEYARIGEAGAVCTLQARSNMNNGVGCAPAHRYPQGALLGTDGIGADMLAELQAAYFRGQEAGVPFGPDAYLRLLTNGAVYAGRRLGVKLGRIEAGYEADLVILDAVAGPPLRTENLAAAMVFRLSSAQVRTVLVGGEPRLVDRETVVDERWVATRGEAAGEALWARMKEQRRAGASL